LIARRTTAPILELQEHTQRVAAGDLDARVACAPRTSWASSAARSTT
jgi:HAMP domain-containing protein